MRFTGVLSMISIALLLFGDYPYLFRHIRGAFDLPREEYVLQASSLEPFRAAVSSTYEEALADACRRRACLPAQLGRRMVMWDQGGGLELLTLLQKSASKDERLQDISFGAGEGTKKPNPKDWKAGATPALAKKFNASGMYQLIKPVVAAIKKGVEAKVTTAMQLELAAAGGAGGTGGATTETTEEGAGGGDTEMGEAQNEGVAMTVR